MFLYLSQVLSLKKIERNSIFELVEKRKVERENFCNFLKDKKQQIYQKKNRNYSVHSNKNYCIEHYKIYKYYNYFSPKPQDIISDFINYTKKKKDS